MGQGVTHHTEETVSGVVHLDVGAAVATALKAVASAVRTELDPPHVEHFALEVTLPEFPEVPATNDLLEALLPHLVPVARFLREAGVPDERAEAVVAGTLEPYLTHYGELRARHGVIDPSVGDEAEVEAPHPPAVAGKNVSLATVDEDQLVITGCGYLRTVKALGGEDLGSWLTCGMEARIARHQGLHLVCNGQFRGERTCRFRDVSEAAEPSSSD